MLSETHITDDISNKEIEIENYDIIQCDSHSRHTGGVIIYVIKSMKWKVVINRRQSKSWALVITIDDKNYFGRFGVIYKSPKEKINDFLSFLHDVCDESINLETRNLIFGDMNLNVGRKTKNMKKYLATVENHGLYQCINQPTRVTKKSSTTIDHILTNVEKLNWIINSKSPVDHYLIEVILNSEKLKMIDKRKVKFTCWKNYSKEKLKDMLKLIEWSPARDVNDITSNYAQT